jgi:hypothetical protein
MSNTSKGEKLYERPGRPRFFTSATGGLRRTLRVLSSPILALAIAVCAWTIPKAQIHTLLMWAIFFVGLSAAGTIFEFGWRWWQYLGELERLLSRFREMVLSNANIEDRPGSNFAYSISAIEDMAGTVVLIIPKSKEGGLRVGSRLWTIHTSTGKSWGTVEVVSIEEDRARAKPIDRSVPAFWERLEDQMRKDPSPPSGFHLEPAVTLGSPMPKIRRRRKKDVQHEQ